MATRNTKNTRNNSTTKVDNKSVGKVNSENITTEDTTSESVTSESVASENVIQEGSYTIDIPEGDVVPVYQDNTGTTSSVTYPNSQPTFDMNTLLNMVGQLQQTVMDLQSQLKEKEEETQKSSTETVSMSTQVELEPVREVCGSYESTQESDTYRILSYLTNKKSDKEITIIHNRERLGGGSTAIRLTGLSIDFHTIGEQRVLTWQQFEELVSKYRKWFDKHIILLAPEHKDLAERYNVPYLTSSTHNVLTRNDLARIGKLSVEELTEFYQSLDKQDQSFLCSYWLGKVYENDPDFYNRYKIETLNRLSDCGAFDNTLTSMNYDYKKNPNNASIVNQGDRVNIGGNNTQQAIRIN